MPKNKENYLDFIPRHNEKNTFDVNLETGIVTIHMVNTGFYAGIAQKFFHTPRVSNIDLDEYGSFVWKHIDGTATVGQIADAVHEQYGEKADPLYERLVKFMQILYNNKFVLYAGKDK